MGKKTVLAILLPLIVLTAGAGYLANHRIEGRPALVSLERFEPDMGLSQELVLVLEDSDSGLRNVRIDMAKDGKQCVLLDRQYPFGGWFGSDARKKERLTVPIEPAALGLTDGEAILSVNVRDYSWRRWFHGNLTKVEKPLRIDTRTPQIHVISQAHNVSQGGAGLVVYRLSETCRQSGVRVAEMFFPGHGGRFADPLIMTCFFALSHEQGPGTRMAVEAMDLAGNMGRSTFVHYIRPKSFPKDAIRLNDAFMRTTIAALAPADSGHASLLDRFLAVNRDMRVQNDDVVRQVSAAGQGMILWDGPFMRLPAAAPRAGFADRREYVFNNVVVDRQVHLGVDLASLAQSPVPAANRGKIAYVGELGIYGLMVMIDHGGGLMSMYAHLSRIDARVGQMVEKGQIIGRTGATGLAGGDHLHYAMLVHTTFVNPVEWWDKHWIADNVVNKLNEASRIAAGG
jgi:murein DD-endopeptidase MepM/ murein hydrolase activator NlpD